jgi:hypothetical protein
MAKQYSYVVGVLIGIDQLANAILAGDPDETISSRPMGMVMPWMSMPTLTVKHPGNCITYQWLPLPL